ncbi:MAG: hypothetical protein ACLGG7_12060 [Bacteriovoracia bacterium]
MIWRRSRLLSLSASASELDVFERVLSDAELSAELRTVRVRTSLQFELEIPALGELSLRPEVELYFSKD